MLPWAYSSLRFAGASTLKMEIPALLGATDGGWLIAGACVLGC